MVVEEDAEKEEGKLTFPWRGVGGGAPIIYSGVPNRRNQLVETLELGLGQFLSGF